MVFANFFFWRPGSQFQNSLNGLYRSLLYDILKACSDLTQDLLPDHWAEAERSSWQIQAKLDVPACAIRAALERIFQDKELSGRLYEKHCFCFFINGLDEYAAAHGEDHLYLVRLLTHWVKNSQGNLKICVSSRDYNVFLDNFPEDQWLQVHELTRFDMQRYVEDNLAHLEDEGVRERLVPAIPEKADGIFLWVTLVVSAIRQKVEDSNRKGS